jgi:hypothetical protein
MPASDEKVAEQIFNGSLALLAVLIAVAGIAAASYDKISPLPEVEPHFRWFLWFVAGLSVLAAVVSLVSLEKSRGRNIRMWFLLGLLWILLIGAAFASVGIVTITL